MSCSNFLHITIPEVEQAMNEVDYYFQIIHQARQMFPLGYIEWQALLSLFYNTRAELVCKQLKEARVQVSKPIIIKWEEEQSELAFLNLVLFPLSFIARAHEIVNRGKYLKALSRYNQLMGWGFQ